MAAVVNKRQQARNERNLQELVRAVPGNDRCADCQARNPGWASWSLGIFLCMRCAALHRKLGTHISKVKSLSMDTWSSEQVENIKRAGNAASNLSFNPRSVRPNIPIDVDEVDGAMERFIREKYQHRTLSVDSSQPASRHGTGSTNSSDDRPPPPPPKNTPRFIPGLRAASSTFPLSRSQTESSLPLPSVTPHQPGNSAIENRRLARLPGGEVTGRRRNFDTKLARLGDMGFSDEACNVTVFRGLHGNLDSAVEALGRLRKGDQTTKTADGNQMHAAANSQEPNGFQPLAQRGYQPTNSQPYDARLPQAQKSMSSEFFTYDQGAPPINPWDDTAAVQPLEYSLQNLRVQQQPLFPNNTGTWAGPNPQFLYQQHNPFLKTFTPPISPSPYQYSSSRLQTNFLPSDMQPPRTHSNNSVQNNPFLRTFSSPSFASSNPYSQAQQVHYWTSPDQQGGQLPLVPPQPEWVQPDRSLPHFPLQSSPQIPQADPQASYSYFPEPQTQSQYPFQSPPVQSPLATDQPPQEFPFQHQYSYPPQQNYPYANQQQQQQPPPPQQQISPNQTPRYNKTSILALYNYPHLAPARPSSSSSNANSQAPAQTTNPEATVAQHQRSPQRSVTMPNVPVAGTLNPFANLVTASSSTRHVSDESDEFAASMGRDGRCSPDAFAGLSARVG